MIKSLFNVTTLPALEQTAMFAERRHELLAGNVANLSTPGYRARDLSVDDFEKELKVAIQQKFSDQTSSEIDASPGRSAGYRQTDPFEGPKKAMDRLVYHDGSDVNMERQVTELAKNQGMHRMAIALMRSQFSVLNAAISERV